MLLLALVVRAAGDAHAQVVGFTLRRFPDEDLALAVVLQPDDLGLVDSDLLFTLLAWAALGQSAAGGDFAVPGDVEVGLVDLGAGLGLPGPLLSLVLLDVVLSAPGVVDALLLGIGQGHEAHVVPRVRVAEPAALHGLEELGGVPSSAEVLRHELLGNAIGARVHLRGGPE